MTGNVLDLTNLRLAVLIDAENVPRNCIKRVMEEIAIYGTPTIKRIYGDWTSPGVAGWKNSLLQNAITPIQQYSYTQGKNSSDSAMIIDAMDILYSNRTDGFVIVSSDSDFTRLAIRLREAGQRVIGIGERKTPSAFIAACDKFTYIEVINKTHAEKRQPQPGSVKNKKAGSDTAVPLTGAAAAPADDATGAALSDAAAAATDDAAAAAADDAAAAAADETAGKSTDDIIELIAVSIADLAGDSGSAFLGELGNLIIKKQPDFDPRNFGFKSLSALLKSIDRFEIEFRQTTDPNIKHVYVKDKMVENI